MAACSPAQAELTPSATFTAPSPPTQVVLPASTFTSAPTATATTQQTEIPPTPTATTVAVPVIAPTQAIIQPPRSYVCPWVEVAQTTPMYTFRVANSYPHDPAAYTQGLIYRDGLLYEGTGLKGQSSLRRVELESGEIEQAIELDPQYFGEGITELDGEIYQLTWREQIGFIYNETTFEQLGTFFYPTEGWGLTHDGERLIMSDGSASLYFLDPETLETVGQVTVSAENLPVPRLNELEYIQGEVWANVYQTSCIARIDPQSGRVLGWLDISGILPAQDLPGSEVPNGIAYDEAGKRIFVTGKHWPKLFEILVVPAN